MTQLSVNVNKIATLRNARGGNVPDLIKVALDCERFGAQGITVHPRPDERHIRYQDVRDLKRVVTTEFNIEGNPIPSFMDLVEEVRPHQVTLVPDAPDALTSNAGWDVARHRDFLTEILGQLHAWGIRTSIFVGTDLKNLDAAAAVGTDRVELYTEPYASDYPADRAKAVAPFVQAAEHARSLRAWHSTLGMTSAWRTSVSSLSLSPSSLEVSIGHALISDALYLGLEETIRRYRACLAGK